MRNRLNVQRKRNRATFVVLFLFCLFLSVACTSSTRQLFFDVTPPSAAELAERARLEAEQMGESEEENDQFVDPLALIPGMFDDSSPRPEVESMNDWKQVEEFLPKDYKKKTDWSAALEQGLVRPRPGADPRSQWAAAFKYDFLIPSEKPKNEAYFPHSAHTEWLGCKNCHVTIYPYKRNPATMKEMKKGASCGTCHGNVAFSLKQCKRCHLNR